MASENMSGKRSANASGNQKSRFTSHAADTPINADATGKTAKKRIKQSPIAESLFAIFRMKAGNIKVRIKVAVKNRIILPARDAGEPNFKFLNRVFFIPFSTNFKFTK